MQQTRRRRRSLRRKIGEREARDEEKCREHRGRPRKERRRTARSEYRARRARAETRPGIRALAALEQHEPHDHGRDQDVRNQHNRLHFRQIPARCPRGISRGIPWRPVRRRRQALRRCPSSRRDCGRLRL